MPRVAVVVATYDRAPLLAEALESVRAQTFVDLECVVCDDGSPDGTPDVAGQATARDRRFRYVRLRHGGSKGKVRNAGIRATSAPLVAFLDDDDVWLPGKLEHQLALLDGAPDAPFVCSRVERFGEGTGVWPRRFPAPRPDLASLLRGSFVALSTVVARRLALEAAGLFPEETHATEDYELWLRMARAAPPVADEAVLARYRVHAGNASRKKPLEAEELSRLFDRVEREWKLPRRLLRPGRRGLFRQRARLASSRRERIVLRLRSLLP